VRRRFAPHQLRHAHAVEMVREGVPLIRHPAPTRTQQPRHHLRLPPRHRQRRDHRNRPRPTRTDDPSQRVAPALTARRSRCSSRNALRRGPSCRTAGARRGGGNGLASSTVASHGMRVFPV
jgi:hypothetical protein